MRSLIICLLVLCGCKEQSMNARLNNPVDRDSKIDIYKYASIGVINGCLNICNSESCVVYCGCSTAEAR